MLGFYGKVPSQGDFVGRNLPADFVQAWDEWLQQRMHYLMSELGDAWLEHYLVSPIWRFYLPRGVVNEQQWTGIWVPSVDKVGRYFPLVFAMPIHSSISVYGIFDGKNNHWYERLEGIALKTLTELLTAEEIERSLALEISGLDDFYSQPNKDMLSAASNWLAIGRNQQPLSLICDALPSNSEFLFMVDPYRMDF